MVTMATKTTTTGKESKWTINKELLPMKIFYFLLYGACMIIPYTAVLLKRLDLTASEIGIIGGSSVIVCLFTRPVIGLMADKLGGRKVALVICCIGFGSCFFSLRFLTRRMDTQELLTIRNNTEGEIFNIWMCHRPSYDELNFDEYKNNINYSNIQLDHYIPCNIARSSENNIPPRIHGNSLTILCPFHQTRNIISQECLSLIVKNQFSTKGFILYYISFENNNNKTLHGINDSYYENSTQYKQISSKIPGCLQQRQHCRMDAFQSIAVKSGNSLTIPFPEDSIKSIHYGDSGGSLFSNVKADEVFLLALTIMLIARAFYSSTTSLADAVAYSLLGSNRHRFANQRLWGSFGTGITVIATTTIATRFDQANDLSALFTVCLSMTVLASVVVVVKLNTESEVKHINLRNDLQAVLSNSTFRLLLCKLILYGFMTGASQHFFMWFIADLGGTSFNLAMTIIVMCVASVIILRFTGRLLKRIGPLRTMYMVLVGHTVRFLAMSFIQSPWMALPIEILHGLTYSVFWAAASGCASKLAAPGTQASCQSIAGAVYWDLGRGLGILITGQFIQEIGARWTFRTYAVTCVVALPLFYLLDRLWPMPPSLSNGFQLEKEVEASIITNEKDKDAEVASKLILSPPSPTPPQQPSSDHDHDTDSARLVEILYKHNDD